MPVETPLETSQPSSFPSRPPSSELPSQPMPPRSAPDTVREAPRPVASERPEPERPGASPLASGRRFIALAARDLAILATTALAWRAAAHWTAADTPLADLFGVGLGLLVGVCGYVLHEWGHLLGALATGSHVAAPARLATVFLFSFDSRRNDLRQFLVMSFSGFAATALVVWGCYGLLPDAWLASRVARGAVLFGVTLTVFIELPLVGYALLGRGLPPVENGIHGRAAVDGA